MDKVRGTDVPLLHICQNELTFDKHRNIIRLTEPSEVVILSLSSRVIVQHSTCYDFFASLLRIENNGHYTPDNNPNQEIRDWAERTLASFDPEVRKLLAMFFSEETGYAMTLSGYAAKWDTQSVGPFLDRLAQVPSQEILGRFLQAGIGPGKDVAIKELVSDDKEAIRFISEHLSFTSKEKWQILQFIMNPEAMKADLLKLLSWYYTNIYAKLEIQVEKYLHESESELREKLSKYGDEYLRLLLPVDFSRHHNTKITLAISYHLEKASSINMLDDVYFYGYRYFEKIENKHVILAGTQVFKALADETRLNIIRLLTKRAWYGHEIAQRLSISNSTVSHHVTMLVMQGLVRTYREDNRVYFEIRPEVFRRVINDTLDNILTES